MRRNRIWIKPLEESIRVGVAIQFIRLCKPHKDAVEPSRSDPSDDNMLAGAEPEKILACGEDVDTDLSMVPSES